MGRIGMPEILIILTVLIVFIAIPVICYKAGKKRGFEIGKNAGFKEGIDYQKKG